MQFGSFIHVPVSKCWTTCSALPVNAKDVSGCVRFRRKLLFHGYSFVHGSCMFFSVLTVLAEYNYSLLCLFGFLGTK